MADDFKHNYLKNALALAFLGDAVFTLHVREILMEKFNEKPKDLNRRANNLVCAKNQAEIMRAISPRLNDLEKDIVMRARNSHLSNRKAKNSTIEEYSLATQFESLVGFWHLNKDPKLNDILDKFVRGAL